MQNPYTPVPYIRDLHNRTKLTITFFMLTKVCQNEVLINLLVYVHEPRVTDQHFLATFYLDQDLYIPPVKYLGCNK